MRRRWRLLSGAALVLAAAGAYLHWLHDWRPSCRNVPSAAEAASWLNAITKPLEREEPFTAEYVACVSFVSVSIRRDASRQRDHFPHPGIGVYPVTPPRPEDFLKLKDLPRLTDFGVDYFEGPAGYADAVAASVGQFKSLIGMRWRAPRLTDTGAAHFGNLKELAALHVYDAALGGNIGAWAALPKLRRIELWDTTLDSRAVARLGDFRNLETLHHSGGRLDGSLEGIARMPALRELLLWRLTLDEEQIASLAGAPKLRLLEISGTTLGPRALAGIARLPQLVSLRLENNRITGGLELLAQAPKLEWLSLAEAKFDDAAGPGLAGLRGVKRIYLGETPAGDRTAAALATMPALEFAHFGQTAITDEGVRALAKAPRLEALSLFKTAVTDAGVAQLALYPRLREVSLQQTKATAAGIAALKAAKPNLVVYVE